MAAYGVKTGIRIYLDSGDIPLMVVLTVAAVLLELWLARREKWWPGLLLPLASLVWAAAGAFSPLGTPSEAPFGLRFMACLRLFLVENVFTLVLLAIYASCRELQRRKCRREQELDKMHIDDL